MQRLNVFLLGFLLVMVVAAAQAQSSPPSKIDVTPVRNRLVSHTPGGMATALEAQISYDLATGKRTSYKQVRVPLSVGTVGNLAKGILKRGNAAGTAYYLFKELVDGAGWAINELGDQVVVPGVPHQELGDTAYCIYSASNRRCASTPGQLSAVAHTGSPGIYEQPCVVQIVNPTLRGYRCVRTGSGGATAFAVAEDVITRPSTGWPTGTNANYGTADTEVTDEELGNLLKPHREAVNMALVDPQTGAIIQYRELTDALNNLRKQIELENGVAPGVDLSVQDPSQQQQHAETEWPGFCAWAEVVCDFIDWVKAPEPETETPEVPFDETFVEQDWSSGIGGGSCPGDVSFTVTLSGASASPSFSYEPICQFATTMRPVIIAMALILVPMLVGGFRGSKDA